MGPKKQKASSAEKASLELGKSQIQVGNSLKGRLDPALSNISKQDNTNILRAKTAAAAGASVLDRLKQPGDAATRTAAVSAGTTGALQANTAAADTEARSKLSRKKTSADLFMGSTSAANNAITSSAAAQNNAAAILTRAAMEKQDRVIGALGSIPTAYVGQKNTMSAFNNDSLRTASVTGAKEYETMNMWGGIKKMPIPKTGG